MVVLDLPSYRALGYQMGGSRVVMTIKDGEPVVVNTHELSVPELDS
jgi:hypothetical protein